jgi:hypothetical protein
MPVPREDAISKARRVFADHGGMLRTMEAINLGIHPRDLYSLRDHGEIEEVVSGQHIAPY